MAAIQSSATISPIRLQPWSPVRCDLDTQLFQGDPGIPWLKQLTAAMVAMALVAPLRFGPLAQVGYPDAIRIRQGHGFFPWACPKIYQYSTMPWYPKFNDTWLGKGWTLKPGSKGTLFPCGSGRCEADPMHKMVDG